MSATSKQAGIRQARYVMGTLVEIIAYGTNQRPRGGKMLLDAVNAAFEEFERLERIFNLHDPESELSRMNRVAAKREFIASPDLFALLRAASDYMRQSAGTFDVTTAPLTRFWRRCERAQRLPTIHEVRQVRHFTGHQHIQLDEECRAVRFMREGITVDFGGLAKGYAVDRATSIICRGGMRGMLINAGESSIAAFGASLGDRQSDKWVIGIRHPRRHDYLLGRLALHNEVLSSSGGGQRPLIIAGRRYSHIIDPRNGQPADASVSATVVSDSAARAEVMSKMMILLGHEAAFARFDEAGWKAEGVLLVETDEMKVRMWRTPGLRDFQALT